MSLADDLAALAALGSADAIAAALQADGDVGTLQEPDACPLANRLTRLGHANTRAWKSVRLSGVEALEIDTSEESELAPPVLLEFVDAFDAGRYPHLIDGRERLW